MIAISCETWRKNDKVNHERIANENSGKYILSLVVTTHSYSNIIYLFIFNKYIFI